MISVPFPEPDFKIRKLADQQQIWDSCRKRWVRLSPEEWVRQNFLLYLQQVLHYPPALIAVEKEIQLGELKKRCDIVVYKEARPWMIVECKETHVPLTEKTLMQLLRYNMSLPVPYLVITNGVENYGWLRKNGELTELAAIPSW